jgi:hypothetical protein
MRFVDLAFRRVGISIIKTDHDIFIIWHEIHERPKAYPFRMYPILMNQRLKFSKSASRLGGFGRVRISATPGRQQDGACVRA